MRNIILKIEGIFDDHRISWVASFNISQLRCTQEKIKIDNDIAVSVVDGKFRFADESESKIVFSYEGSILSVLDNKVIENNGLSNFLSFMKKIYSFGTLNSKQLRIRTRPADKDTNIGRGGEFLSGKIASFSPEQRRKLVSQIQEFYPWIADIHTVTLRGGWEELYFTETCEEGNLHRRFSSQNSCDGLLRIVGFLTEFMTSDTFIVFDEIENGFNPEIMEKLVHTLTHCGKQIIITTHNPVIIDYIQEDIAVESTLLVFKNADGTTGIRRFFEIPEAKERLSFLSLGEVFLDLDIDETLRNIGS